MGAGLADLALEAAPIEQTATTFDALAESIGEASDAMLDDLTAATNGMVNDADLMLAANQMMSMGLADSSDQAAEFAAMATRLGMAMGNDATASMADFNAMLANQSLPRLDSFGISSGVVRERINELMRSVEGMTRETAFLTAVSEQGTVAMERLGDAGADGAAASMAQLQATLDNLKATVGTAFLPVLETLLGTLADLAETYGPMLAEWASSTAGVLLEGLAPALEMVAQLFASPEFMAFVQELGTALTGLLTQVVGLLVNDVLPPLLQLAQDLLPVLTPLISGVLDAVLPLVAELVSRLVPVLMDILNAILPPLLPLFDMLADIVLTVVDAVLPLAVTLLELLLPPIMNLISTLLPALMPLLAGLMEAFVEILTALMPLVEVLLAELLPIFTDLIISLLPPLTELLLAVVDVFVYWLEALIPVVVALVQELAPIISALADLLSNALGTALEAVTGLIENVIGPAMEWWKAHIIEPLMDAIHGIGDAISGVLDWIHNLADDLGGLSLPDWLTPGSPTPFENGLRGIADAMAGMPLGDFNVGMGGLAGAGAGGMGAPISIMVNIGSVTEGNAQAAGQQAGRGIVDELRRQGVIV